MNGCGMMGETKINWCTQSQLPDDSSKPLMLLSSYVTCKNVDIPDLHLNDQFIIQQIVTNNGLTNYYLTGTEVWYTGNGLSKKATIISMNNTITGQVLVQLKAEIAWRFVTIKIVSTLSNTYIKGSRLLVQTEYDPVNGESEVIECIKADETDQCATCEQECESNGFAQDGCDECCDSRPCSQSQSIEFIFLTLLLTFII